MALGGTLVVMLGLGFGTSHVACVEHMQCHRDGSGSAAVRAGWRSCGHSRRALVRNSWQAALEQRLQALPVLWALTAAGLLLRTAHIAVLARGGVRIPAEQDFLVLDALTGFVLPQRLVFHRRTGRSSGAG